MILCIRFQNELNSFAQYLASIVFRVCRRPIRSMIKSFGAKANFQPPGTWWRRTFGSLREGVFILFPGFFADSLKREPATEVGPVAYARIDCDIYEATRDCLDYLGPRLSHGAVLVFDDWPHELEYGEARAFSEWLPTAPNLRFEFLFFGTWGHFYTRVWHRDKETSQTLGRTGQASAAPAEPTKS